MDPDRVSYERLVAEKPVNEGRAFNKPMLYDQDEDDVFPDFVLTDCASGEVPMEVFGRNDEEYLKRTAEKTALYDRRYGQGRWWAWDATRGSNGAWISPFPEPSRPAPK